MLKYVKNILAGSFKAMVREARDIDDLITGIPSPGVRWGRVPVPGPDPFTAAERNKILGWLRTEKFRLSC